MTEKPTKPARKRVITRRPKTGRPKPTHNEISVRASHDEISVRAYFLHLEAPEADEMGNWLRAEREMMAA